MKHMIFGVFVRQGTPDEVIPRRRATYAVGAAHPDFQQPMDDRGFKMMSISGAEATSFLTKWQSVTSWVVWDGGMAKKSPEEFGIPRP